MADITSYSDDHWALSADVAGEVTGKVRLKRSGDTVDVEEQIESATGTVQSWWKEATGKDWPTDLPDPSTLADTNSLLADATEYLAASLAHEKFTENVRGTDDEREEKHVFLEDRARKQFDAWVTLYGHDEVEDGTQGDTRATTAQIDSLVNLPERE